MLEYVILIALLLLYFFVYVTGVYFLVVVRRKKRTERKENFFKVLIEGLKTGSIATMDDVVNIYKGVAGLSSEDLSYRYGLSKQLREFLVAIVSKNEKFIDSSLGDDVIRDWKQKISEFIKKNKTTSPYADLPAAERNVLSDITTFLEMNDPDSVKRKTLELAGMIQARNDDLNRIQNINRWAVPLSVIGLILTIAFGVLAWV